MTCADVHTWSSTHCPAQSVLYIICDLDLTPLGVWATVSFSARNSGSQPYLTYYKSSQFVKWLSIKKINVKRNIGSTFTLFLVSLPFKSYKVIATDWNSNKYERNKRDKKKEEEKKVATKQPPACVSPCPFS